MAYSRKFRLPIGSPHIRPERQPALAGLELATTVLARAPGSLCSASALTS